MAGAECVRKRILRNEVPKVPRNTIMKPENT